MDYHGVRIYAEAVLPWHDGLRTFVGKTLRDGTAVRWEIYDGRSPGTLSVAAVFTTSCPSDSATDRAGLSWLSVLIRALPAGRCPGRRAHEAHRGFRR